MEKAAADEDASYNVTAEGTNNEEKTEESGSSEEVEEEVQVAKGKHYTVFAFQNWSPKHKSIHFVAARFSLASMSSRWERKANRLVTAMLASCHIYSVGNAYDGASENRCWMNRELSITLRELAPDLYDAGATDAGATSSVSKRVEAIKARESDGLPLDPTKRKFTEDELPWDLPVAYPHPTVDGLTILALADMSHGIKKVANAVERANLRGLQHQPINMDMLKAVYMETPDMKSNVSGQSSIITLVYYLEIFQPLSFLYPFEHTFLKDN